jgi:hypothetical protein
VNGVDEWQNDFRLNGINDNIEIYGGNYTLTNAAIVPPPDAIQEFTLQSGDFNAEFGHSTGGIINASLKSGTNGVHGDLWEYVRNDDLNANYFFNRTCSGGVCTAGKIPDYHQNLFGFTAGGPDYDPAPRPRQEPALLVHRLSGRPLRIAREPGGQNRALPATWPAAHFTNLQAASEFGSNFTNLQRQHQFPQRHTTDALGRVFPNGTILDPATTRHRRPVAPTPSPEWSQHFIRRTFVRDPFFNCTAAEAASAATTRTRTGPLAGITRRTTLKSSLNVIPTSRIDPERGQGA